MNDKTKPDLVETEQAGPEAQPLVYLPSNQPDYPAMISSAIDKGLTGEALEKLMDLQERWQGSQARMAFDAAVADAKEEIPTIRKNRTVSFGAGKATYQHEDMGEIAKTIDPILTKNGLSYRYRANQEGSTLFVTCVLAHRDGHSEETTLSAPHDTSGSKNPIQAVGSAATYLQRYTLKLALGLAASKDDDAQAVSNGAVTSNGNGKITEVQFNMLVDLAEELDVDKIRFCKVFGLNSMADIKANDFKKAIAKMEMKRVK